MPRTHRVERRVSTTYGGEKTRYSHARENWTHSLHQNQKSIHSRLRFKYKNPNYKTPRRKYKGKTLWRWSWQWFLGYGTKSTSNTSKYRLVRLNQTEMLRSNGKNHKWKGNLQSPTSLPPNPGPLGATNLFSTSMSLTFLDSTYRWGSVMFLCLDYFT